MMNKTKDIYQEIEEDRIWLTSRWQSDKGQDMLANVIAALQSRQPWAHFLSELPDIEEVFAGWDLRGAPLAGINFAGADFKEVDLYFTDLSGANLELCDFRGAEVGYANFSDANLVGANFEGCFMARINLSRANLSNAELMRAVLAGGNLVEANFCGADLTGATLLGAKLEGTVFDGAILQDVRWGEFAKEDSSSDTLESTSLEDIQISTTDTDCESPDIKRE
ncbi:pentapeptide repeat-containing protein [Microcoleus sp. AT8-B1]|uniref:pentapeptide repeat-containing protein n=1 Tax=unclassified Microcoleus TaxID=2642155 RepID=UPI002FD3AA86